MGTLSKMLFALAMVAAPGCLGSDTDLNQPIDTGTLANPKPAQTPHAQVLGVAHASTRDGIATTIELGTQTVTAVGHFDGQRGEVVVYSDPTGEQLCAVTLGPTIDTVKTDNCDILNDDKSLAAM
jgi:hypothetical protein